MNNGPIQVEAPTLYALILFTMVSLGLGVVANLVASRQSGFLQRYFLGNRSMGALSVALTAAVMSGGTFLGFPSLVYSFGWVVGLWIASYMVAPLTYLGFFGKRIGQLARRTGAITLPDLMRERFGSPNLGVLSSLVIIVFLSVFMVAQFAAGARIIKTVLPGSPAGGGIAAMAKAASEDLPAGEAATDPKVAAAPDPKATAAQLEVRKEADRRAYLIGLAIFTFTVVAYTAYGGFLAAVWTDVFQSLVMALGVMILLPLALYASGGLEEATAKGVSDLGSGFAFGPGAGRNFFPITMAFSYFVMWAITGAGQPSTLVRLMAFRDSRTLRYSIIYVTIYNLIIYVPLIFIFIAARKILPPLESSDDAMPTLVVTLANPWVAGIIMAAPYGAVLSTVSGWLLIIASGLVRDIYQRFLRPTASEKEIERASYFGTIFVGLAVAWVAIEPPSYLQLIVVFASSGLAAAFLMPAAMAAYWRRGTGSGAIAAMIAGAGVTLLLYLFGKYPPSSFGLTWLPDNPDIGPKSGLRPYYLLGFEPCVWGILASVIAGIVGSLLSPAPDPARVALLFDEQPANAPAPASVELHPELGAQALDDVTQPASRPGG